ncbi:MULTISPECIES: hypothetical protein [unclassified Bartonella]
MNISLDKVKNVIELAAKEMKSRESIKYTKHSDIQIDQNKLDMNGSLEV